MKFILFFSLLLVYLGCAGPLKTDISARPASNYEFSVLQGSTDETSTVLRIVYPNYLNPSIRIFDDKNQSVSINRLKEFKNPAYEFKSVHIFLKDLSPKKLYQLEISMPGERWKDTRTFKTLAEKNKLKILVASCMNDTYNEIGNAIWPKAFSHKPDVVFLIGDNLYADIYSGIYIGARIPSTPDHLWRRHVDHAMVMKLYRMKHLTPIFVTWDDHDYGLNDGDKNYKYKIQAKKIFNSFFPVYENDYLKLGHGVGSALSFKNYHFYFLDGRSFRDSSKNKDGYHLGTKQRKWLYSNLKKHNGQQWLILGDQFFGGYHPYESFEGLHPKRFKEFLDQLKNLEKDIVFLSGDRHLIEVMKIDKKHVGVNTYEYTVSGVHTKTYEGALKRDPNPRRVDGFDGKENYAIIEVFDKNKINFKAYSLNGLEISREDQISR